jgi:hypothetical protein
MSASVRGGSTTFRILIGLVVVLGFAGCAREDTVIPASPAPTVTQFIQPTIPPSSTPPISTLEATTATPTVGAVSTIPPSPSPEGPSVQPIAVAPLARVYNFSPNSETLAYWVAIDAPEVGFDNPAGQLHFLNVHTDQACLNQDTLGYSTRFLWLLDGSFSVFTSDGVRTGTPCKDGLTTVTDTTQLETNAPDLTLSPDGQYRASTIKRGDAKDGLLDLETRIVAVATGQTKNIVRWIIDERVTGPGEQMGLGGEWIGQDQFLIYQSIDQGPLLVKVGGKTVQVAPELFSVPAVPPSTDLILAARGASVAGSNTYHIILSGGSGSDADFPSISLYHSDTGEVEILPYKHTWEPVFSPDGHWLLLDERPRNNGHESYALWARAVDPAGSQLHKLGEGDALSVAWSPSWREVALGDVGRISVLTFPEGVEKGAWATGDYSAIPRAWSPDGNFLAIEGYVSDVRQQAVFVVPAP